MQIKINQSSLDFLKDRFKKAHDNKQFFTKNYTWGLDLIKNYVTVVRSAMGSIEARGGYISMTFLDTTTGKEYWKNLAPETLRRRAEKWGKTTEAGSSDPYGEYKWDFKIYEDTGNTKTQVKAYRAPFLFGGISAAESPLAFTRARAQETGKSDNAGNIPQRRLFAVANDLFLKAIHDDLASHGKVHKQMTADFISFLEWGKKTHFKG